MSMTETLNEKVIPAVMKFVNLKPVAALNEWIASIFGAGWTEPLFQAYNSSFKMIAIVATMGIAYSYAKNEDHEPLAAAVMTFVSFILTQNLFIKSAAGEIVSGVIPMTWTGGEGMVSASIIGLLVGITYSWFLERKITIKMPAGVPQGVANSFAALIPAAVIILITGAGITIGLVICMLFFAKSQQSKQLGRLAVGPGMFNINEPVTFGTPIVMNPFIAAPVVSAIIAYFAIATGLVPPFSGVLVPWTAPPVISGFILGGWKTAALQIVCLSVSFFIYFPFFKKVDSMNYKNEQDALKPEEVSVK